MELIFINGEDIDPANFKKLSELHQEQLFFTITGSREELETAKKENLTKALSSVFKSYGGELCEFWQVAEENNPGNILYDVWLWNADTGRVFITGTTEFTEISMIQFYFDPQVLEEDEQLEEISDALNDAFERKPKRRKDKSLFLFNNKDEVVDFVKPEFIPTKQREWTKALTRVKISEDFIRKYQNQMTKKNWELISQYGVLSESFIRENQQKLDWEEVSRYQDLSESFIIEFQDKIDWETISHTQTLSESFIIQYQKKLDWECISWGQTLSEDFIRKFAKKLSWDSLCAYQQLSEDFIREFQAKVSWYDIVQTQKLSVAFLKEFESKINWVALSMNSNLSEEIIRAFPDKIKWFSVGLYNSNAANILTEERVLTLKEIYPDKELWKDIFSEAHHLSKEFKKEFMSSLKKKV